MVRQRWGRIINVASIAAYLHQLGAFATDPNNFELGGYAYQHSKFSVIGLTRHMAGQLGQFGVTVNCIAPGLVMTPATELQVPKEFQPMFAEMSAMKTNTQAQDMVGPAVFFAGDDSAKVNGQLLCVDGGNVMPV
jgi:3-oxoacyl-[acyl-carrier protein] reductase